MSFTAGLSALGSLKSLYDLAREMRDSNDPDKLRIAAAQMFDLSLAAREQTAALQEERNAAVIELAALKAEIKQANHFDEKAENYTREITNTGATVYREKAAAGDESQSPYFCPNCFANKRLSILNPAPNSDQSWRCNYICPDCDAATILPVLR